MTEFEAKSVVDAINRMFRGTSFSICTVDDCMELTGATRTESYAALRLYHCVGFDKMDRDTKDRVFKAALENVCNIDDFPAVRLIARRDEIEEQLTLDRKELPLMKRLFGRT